MYWERAEISEDLPKLTVLICINCRRYSPVATKYGLGRYWPKMAQAESCKRFE